MKEGELLITLLNAATIGHVLHLQSRSYSEHKALEKFYTQLPDLVDAVIEAWQGRNGELIEYPDQMVELSEHKDSLQFLMFLKIVVEDDRYVLGQESEIQNLVDDIAQLIDSTIYKLTFLK
jgi:DNA-binding ferritin-like protein